MAGVLDICLFYSSAAFVSLFRYSVPWVLGYHSQGRSISVYADLDIADVDELHDELCRITRQGRDKFRVKSNLEYN